MPKSRIRTLLLVLQTKAGEQNVFLVMVLVWLVMEHIIGFGFAHFQIIRKKITIRIRDIDTRLTRCPSAGHSGMGNLENFGKKLFITNPLGVLFTKSRRGML